VSVALSLVETMDAEQVSRLIAGAEEHRAQLGRKRASTLAQDGRSEVPVDDCTSEPSDDFPEIPSGLDRRHEGKGRAA
jgi:hypothetical protein